jgi:inhibitor of cysteine peptidase
MKLQQSGETPRGESALMDIDEDVNGQTREVTAHETVVLTLEEIPTSGYRWHVEADEGVTVEDSQFVRAPDAGIGGGGRRVIRLRVSGTGEFAVHAKLWREWQGDSSVVRRCDFVLRCESP